MSDVKLCYNCDTPEYCYDFDCLKEQNMSERCSDCETSDTCNRGGCVKETVCCGDPSDCTEDCSNRNEAELDGRNEGPTNRFGCSYVDCDCTSPCYEDGETDTNTKNVYITINGDFNGDINL